MKTTVAVAFPTSHVIHAGVVTEGGQWRALCREAGGKVGRRRGMWAVECLRCLRMLTPRDVASVLT